MAKSGKMRHKQIMAMNGTTPFIIGLNLVQQLFVNVLSFPLYETLSATYIACRRKKQYFLPSRSEILNNLAHNNFIWEKDINEI